LNRAMWKVWHGNLYGASIAINGYYGPCRFTPERKCYTVLILQFFLKADIKRH
jgi:hypothetical protein